MIEPGSPAPSFNLPDQDGRHVSLAKLEGRRTVLAFYPLDFSPVCTDQLSAYEERLDEIEQRGAKLYGVSVDSAFTHNAFRRHLGVRIPLLSDFNPKGEVSSAYGVYLERRGHSERALVLIGPDLTVEWAYRPPSPLEMPSADLIVDALDARRTA
jgi:peroxiredoxin